MSILKRWRLGRPAHEMRVLMVCMGNICRSPMAEGVLRGKLSRAGLSQRVGVASAGTHSHAGSAPDPRAQKAAAGRGYDLSDIRARDVQPADFEEFHWVLAMDQDNLDHLLQQCPESERHKVQLLLEAAPRSDGKVEVPDPYYGGVNGFMHVLDLLEPACDALVMQIHDRLRQLA